MQLTNVTNMSRLKLLEATTRKHSWRLMHDVTLKMLDGSSFLSLGKRKAVYDNFIIGDGWEYVEITLKLGKKEVTYAIMRVELARRLPNIVFDSREHQKRQYRLIFDKKQCVELEGDFNNYFVTYFGESYVIDDLSFITPEVMQALINAKQYDIEIAQNNLLLFGPIKADPEQQLLDMSQKIRLIHEKLMNNIVTYRDERLPYKKGRVTVSKEGMFLKYRYLYGTVLQYVIVLLALVFGIYVTVSALIVLYALF